MKSLFKIIRRYIGTAFFITFTILFLNIIFYAALVLNYSNGSNHAARIEDVSRELEKTEDGYELTKAGEEMLSDYEFAFLLDDAGNMIWSNKLPDGFATQYTASQIASFSRWYLNDYPVMVWDHPDGLLVMGEAKNSIWKGDVRIDYSIASHSISIIFLVFGANAVLVLFLCLIFGLRFYNSLKPVVAGIENLSEEKNIDLSEKGIASDLAKELNQTSRILQKQRKLISDRDEARTNWVAGVSHDIRTPLSMIMGYAEQMENETALEDAQKKKAGIIKQQSLKIKKLIEDLNLTSKLEYNMQPLRMEKYHPARLMRNIVTAYYNNGLEDRYSIDLSIAESVEGLELNGDVQLLTRAFENLIGNSIRHNEEGCEVSVLMEQMDEEHKLKIVIEDNGSGINPEVIQELGETSKNVENAEAEKADNLSKPHIMGLHVVKQVITAHKGNIIFENKEKGARITIIM